MNYVEGCKDFPINPVNAELNPIWHLLALLGRANIVVVSRLRVKCCTAVNLIYWQSKYQLFKDFLCLLYVFKYIFTYIHKYIQIYYFTKQNLDVSPKDFVYLLFKQKQQPDLHWQYYQRSISAHHFKHKDNLSEITS
jgi:hypothetical protein